MFSPLETQRAINNVLFFWDWRAGKFNLIPLPQKVTAFKGTNTSIFLLSVTYALDLQLTVSIRKHYYFATIFFFQI